mmetsp:Transcript_2734/g.8275  ORF Transcript_2734/g.8275 Transcript_2734/m.8275 type:complete len:318 (-) Transcript_2734:661-1614(-)
MASAWTGKKNRNSIARVVTASQRANRDKTTAGGPGSATAPPRKPATKPTGTTTLRRSTSPAFFSEEPFFASLAAPKATRQRPTTPRMTSGSTATRAWTPSGTPKAAPANRQAVSGQRPTFGASSSCALSSAKLPTIMAVETTLTRGAAVGTSMWNRMPRRGIASSASPNPKTDANSDVSACSAKTPPSTSARNSDASASDAFCGARARLPRRVVVVVVTRSEGIELELVDHSLPVSLGRGLDDDAVTPACRRRNKRTNKEKHKQSRNVRWVGEEKVNRRQQVSCSSCPCRRRKTNSTVLVPRRRTSGRRRRRRPSAR